MEGGFTHFKFVKLIIFVHVVGLAAIEMELNADFYRFYLIRRKFFLCYTIRSRLGILHRPEDDPRVGGVRD